MRPQLVGLVEQGQVEESPVGLDRVGWKSVGLSWVVLGGRILSWLGWIEGSPLRLGRRGGGVSVLLG